MDIHFDWFLWITDQLVADPPVADDAIQAQLCKALKLSDDEASELVGDIKNHPLMAALIAKNHQLENREWHMLMQSKMARIAQHQLTVADRAPSFTQFVRDFYSPNRPLLIKNAIADWPAAELTPLTLLNEIGDTPLEVMAGRNDADNCEIDKDRFRRTMPFNEFFEIVMANKSGNNLYLTAANRIANQKVLAPFIDGKIGDFADGYLDPAMQEEVALWFGPEGTHTSLHHDKNNNLLIQVHGRKRVYLVSPAQTPLLYNTTLCFSPIDLSCPDLERYPLAEHIQPYEVELNAGDALFIPAGWWHQIESLSISINLSMTHFKVDNGFPDPGSLMGLRPVPSD